LSRRSVKALSISAKGGTQQPSKKKQCAVGLQLIGTSGNYADGLSEKLISHVIAGQRDLGLDSSVIDYRDASLAIIPIRPQI
jgi:hypothetical protein